MELLLLLILITLLGAWPFVGVTALILAGLLAIGWALYGIWRLVIWIVENWSEK